MNDDNSRNLLLVSEENIKKSVSENNKSKISGSSDSKSYPDKGNFFLDVIAKLPKPLKLGICIILFFSITYIWYSLISINRETVNWGNEKVGSQKIKNRDDKSCKPFEPLYVLTKDDRWEYTGCE